MEEKFKQLQEAGRTCVDCLVEWIKESKIIDNTKEAEEKAREMFGDMKNRHSVEIEKFKEVVGKLAEQEKKSVDQLSQMLVDVLPKIQDALAKAAEAFQESMSKK